MREVVMVVGRAQASKLEVQFTVLLFTVYCFEARGYGL